MTREQAINYLFSCGFTNEQVGEVVRALTYEPTTKNNLGVDCISRDDVRDVMQELWGTSGELLDRLMSLPSVTPQLSVPEVTALAEWTAKLTKASEEAYNKGYEAGRKELEPITSKDKFIYALTACGCLLKDGKTWYEHNELIKCFEDLGLFEQEPRKGHWIGLKKIGFGEWKECIVPLKDGFATDSCSCSECGDWLTGSDEYQCSGNFCPNCGADMRGEE